MTPGAAASPVAVLGAGSWGTALAVLIARNGPPVLLWGADSGHVDAIRRNRRNERYLPGVTLPENLSLHADLGVVASATDRFLFVVPSRAFRETLSRLAATPAVDHEVLISWGTKGFDPEHAMLLSDVVVETFPRVRVAVISGPSFAREVAGGLPTALTVAAPCDETAEEVANWLRGDRLRVYTSRDVAGVQLGGAIKNVMALAAGISDGLGFGANARAALITRGLAEMNRLGVALGGNPQTFMGLTGVGDLVLTCTDDQSRNRRAGIGLGRGRPLAEVLREIGQEVEGINTARELYTMAGRAGVEMPIAEQVYRVLYEGLAPAAAVETLLKREPRAE